MIKFAPYARTDEERIILWHELQKIPWAIHDNLTSETFQAQFENENNWLFHIVEENKIVGFVGFIPINSLVLEIHAFSFDKRWKARLDRINELCEKIVDTTPFKLIRAITPDGGKTRLALFTALEWDFDGVCRGAFTKDNELVDATIYSFTKETSDAIRRRRRENDSNGQTNETSTSGTEYIVPDVNEPNVPEQWDANDIRRVPADGPETYASNNGTRIGCENARYTHAVWWRSIFGSGPVVAAR
jgi:hypothetical protein